MFEIACILKVIRLNRSVEMEIKSNFMIRVLWGNQILEFAKSLVKQKDQDPQKQLLTAVTADACAVLFCLKFFTSLLTELAYSELRVRMGFGN